MFERILKIPLKRTVAIKALQISVKLRVYQSFDVKVVLLLTNFEGYTTK